MAKEKINIDGCVQVQGLVRESSILTIPTVANQTFILNGRLRVGRGIIEGFYISSTTKGAIVELSVVIDGVTIIENIVSVLFEKGARWTLPDRFIHAQTTGGVEFQLIAKVTGTVTATANVSITFHYNQLRDTCDNKLGLVYQGFYNLYDGIQELATLFDTLDTGRGFVKGAFILQGAPSEESLVDAVCTFRNNGVELLVNESLINYWANYNSSYSDNFIPFQTPGGTQWRLDLLYNNAVNPFLTLLIFCYSQNPKDLIEID